MQYSSKVDDQFPTPPPYFIPDEGQAQQDVRVYHIHSPFSAPSPPPPLVFSPEASYPNKDQAPLPVSPLASSPPMSRFVSYETALFRSPGLTTCPSCQTQVTTQVTYCVGTYAWLMCLVFVLCGLVLGCCLIPFFMRHFKDAYHTCPRCQRVLHIHKKTCC